MTGQHRIPQTKNDRNQAEETEGQHQARKTEAQHRAKQTEDQHPTPQKKLSHWFWGTILFLAIATLALATIAYFQTYKTQTEVRLVKDRNTAPEKIAQPVIVELHYKELKAIAEKARLLALTVARSKIAPKVEEAYKPVYANIKIYADLHYSVAGTYLELSQAALGTLSDEIQTKLFGDLAKQLDEISPEILDTYQATFATEFESETAAILAVKGSIVEIGELTNEAISQTKTRFFTVSGPVAVVGGAASVKLGSKVVASKIMAKVGTKVAAKAGAKWATVASGAGVSAAACAWSGPFAALCATGGAVLTWVGVDYGMVQLDEHLNRAEFEANLRRAIDEDKVARIDAITKALVAMTHDHKIELGRSAADFTLKQLVASDRIHQCAQVNNITALYESFRTSISARTNENVASITDDMKVLFDDPVLGYIAREVVDQVILVRDEFELTHLRIEGTLPHDDKANRDLSAIVKTRGQTYEVKKGFATANKYISIHIRPDRPLRFRQSLEINYAIEQHNYMLKNTFWHGSVELDMSKPTDEPEGLRMAYQSMAPIYYFDEASEKFDKSGSKTKRHSLRLKATLTAPPMPTLKFLPDC